MTFSPVKSKILTGASNQNKDNCTASQFDKASRFTGWVSPKPPRADKMSPTSFNARLSILIAAFSSIIGRGESTIHRWLHTYKVGGLSLLLEEPPFVWKT